MGPLAACFGQGVAQPDAPRIISEREAQTTAVLVDGRVLVVGGQGSRDSAEVYDPVPGEWSRTGSLETGRYWHTATLLLDGRVLVAGGSNCRSNCRAHNALNSVEIYDPDTGTWSAGPPMYSARWEHAAVRLQDGRVLVAGGIGPDGEGAANSIFPPLTLAEVYDPVANSWEQVTPMNLPRDEFRALLLTDGRVFVAGGGVHTDPRRPRETGEVYDPISNTWVLTERAPLGEVQWIALLPDGTVLSMSDFHLRKVQQYDPATNTWHALESEQSPYDTPEPVLLSDGRVLASGRTQSGNRGRTSVADAAIFDPRTGGWTPTGSMGVARGIGSACGPTVTVFCSGHTPVLLHDGKVLVYGGRQAQNSSAPFPIEKPVLTSEIYDPTAGAWSPRGR